MTKLFAPKAKAPPAPPPIPKPTPMPVPDTEADLERKKREAAKRIAKTGRESTIRGSDTLG